MPGFAVETPQAAVLRPCSDQLADSVIPCSHPASIQRASLKKRAHFTALLQMPHCHCRMCRSPLLMLNVCHAWGNPTLTLCSAGLTAPTCESFSLASLRSRIAFFSESNSAPCALLFSSSQGPVKKKQWGRGFEQPGKSKLTPAQCPRASPSPQKEHSPVLFTQHDQHPSAAASNMISFGVSDNELDDSLSLAASDTEELLGSVTDPTLLPTSSSHNARLRANEELILVMTKAVNEHRLEWSPPEEPSRSRLDEWFLPGHHQALRQCLSPFFPEVHKDLTRSWCSPYSSRIRPSASVAHTSVDGAEEKGNKHLPWWVCGRTSLPAHSNRMEDEGEPFVQAVQSHICTCWMRLLCGWTSGFSASLDGCAPGLPGQDARQWGSRSGFSLFQGTEEHVRPGSTHHQSHRQSHRAFNVQPDSIGVPPLAHDDGDERVGQSSLLHHSGLVR